MVTIVTSPRVLAENSGVKPKEVISKLYAAHEEGKVNMGFDIDGDSGEIKVDCSCDVFDVITFSLGLSRVSSVRSAARQEVGSEVRVQCCLHHPESGPDHHGQEGGRPQA